jgi:hypothetical protein
MRHFLAIALALGMVMSSVAARAQSPPERRDFKVMQDKDDGDIPTPATSFVNLFYNGSNFRYKKDDGSFVDLWSGSGGSAVAGVVDCTATTTNSTLVLADVPGITFEAEANTLYAV